MAKKSAASIAPISILKIGTCPTLSERSELTFHIGCNADSEAHIRVVQNSGNGQFNADWVALSLIEKLLNEHPADKPMTSRVMQPVFRSKSSNSPAFLFAALKAEGLVKAGVEKDSGYLIGDIESFKKAMTVLIDQGIDLSTPADTPSLPTKKRTATGGK
jgi:hypothetical protein